jgi:DNA-dependent protein kinase catalytic subunit
MSTFKSVDIFNLLIGVFVQEEHHIHEAAIRRNVEDFTNGLGLRKFMEVAEYCFRYVNGTQFFLCH